jgi:hypothetical protein
MSTISKPKVYRDLIDELVRVCHEGPGQVGAERVRSGMWNANASPEFLADQHAINVLLSRLSESERQILAQMLAREVQVGVFETLKALELFGFSPFQDGYEGSPYDDVVGRLAGWEWPDK